MARLPFVDPENPPDALRPVFEQLLATRGRVPGMYRLLAHQPDVLAAHRAYFHAALDAGILPRPFKEKIAYKVARLRGSVYSSASHRSYALRHGVSDTDMDAVDRGDYAALPAPERAALDFADKMVAARGNITDADMAALQAHFATAEVIEIVALIGIMELASSFGAVFGLEAEAKAPD